MLNTFQVAFLGIVFATALGILIGVMRLSTYFLVNRIAAVYIDIFRNIPLLVLLIFWAQAVFLKLPRVAEAVVLPGPIFLSNRGVAIPWGIPTESWGTFLIGLVGGIVARRPSSPTFCASRANAPGGCRLSHSGSSSPLPPSA